LLARAGEIGEQGGCYPKKACLDQRGRSGKKKEGPPYNRKNTSKGDFVEEREKGQDGEKASGRNSRICCL